MKNIDFSRRKSNPAITGKGLSEYMFELLSSISVAMSPLLSTMKRRPRTRNDISPFLLYFLLHSAYVFQYSVLGCTRATPRNGRPEGPGGCCFFEERNTKVITRIVTKESNPKLLQLSILIREIAIIRVQSKGIYHILVFTLLVSVRIDVYTGRA